MMAFVLTMGAHGQTDSIDHSQFVVAYDFVTNTTDKNGNAATDSVQLAVIVGRRSVKCMEFNRAMIEDFGEWDNQDYQFGESGTSSANLCPTSIGRWRKTR